MAPITPSPFRFAGAGAQRRQRSPDGSGSTLAANKDICSGKDANHPGHHATQVTASQFAPTPRFSSSRRPQQSEISRPDPLYKSNFAQALQASRHPLEDVEEAAQSQEDGHEMLDNDQSAIVPLTGEAADLDVTSSGSVSDLPYSPKRRRLDEPASSNPDQVSIHHQAVPKPDFLRPAVPATHFTQVIPQFTHSTDTIDSVIGNLSALRRPTFLRPPVIPSEAGQQPLPEVFSPHRRGQKFVPGGMAATVQQWVIETGQAAVQNRRKDGSTVGDDYVARVHVQEVNGNGPFLIRGLLANGSQARMLLTGESSGSAHGNKEVLVDTVVAVRAPVVEVELNDGTWSIGVDWKTLS